MLELDMGKIDTFKKVYPCYSLLCYHSAARKVTRKLNSAPSSVTIKIYRFSNYR